MMQSSVAQGNDWLRTTSNELPGANVPSRISDIAYSRTTRHDTLDIA